jgi:putative (di)nucleoside polyphosphate hydrolase
MSSLRYRPNVAAIIKRPDGKIFIGERCDVPGALEALSRELQEEVSLEPEHYRVIESNGPYRYVFLPGRTKEGFDGQEQTFFLVELTAPDSSIEVGTEEPEFSQFRWIEPGEFQTDWVPGFKQEVYRQVFADFFGIHF